MTLHCFSSARRAGSHGRAWSWAVAAAASYILALASKEISFALPAVLLWLEIRGRRGGLGNWRRRSDVLIALGMVFIGAVALRLAYAPPRATSLYFAARDVPVAFANLTALYAKLLVWPTELRALYDHVSAIREGPATLTGFAIWLGAAAIVIAGRRHGPRLGLACIWIAAFLLPVLHLVPIATLAAERYLYLPSIGLGLGIAVLVQRAPEGRARRLAATLAAAIALVGLVGTLDRASDWRSGVHLWGSEIGRPHASFKAFQNLGAALAERGAMDAAGAAWRQAWNRRPGHPVLFRNLVRMHTGPRSPAALALEPPVLARLRRDALAPKPEAAVLADWARHVRSTGNAALTALLADMAARLESTATH